MRIITNLAPLVCLPRDSSFGSNGRKPQVKSLDIFVFANNQPCRPDDAPILHHIAVVGDAQGTFTFVLPSTRGLLLVLKRLIIS
jgi:hypothetical protein